MARCYSMWISFEWQCINCLTALKKCNPPPHSLSRKSSKICRCHLSYLQSNLYLDTSPSLPPSKLTGWIKIHKWYPTLDYSLGGVNKETTDSLRVDEPRAVHAARRPGKLTVPIFLDLFPPSFPFNLSPSCRHFLLSGELNAVHIDPDLLNCIYFLKLWRQNSLFCL